VTAATVAATITPCIHRISVVYTKNLQRKEAVLQPMLLQFDFHFRLVLMPFWQKTAVSVISHPCCSPQWDKQRTYVYAKLFFFFTLASPSDNRCALLNVCHQRFLTLLPPNMKCWHVAAATKLVMCYTPDPHILTF